MTSDENRPAKGDWVQVWAQVKKTSDMDGVHPEDMLVEFFSHSEQYACHIRNDRVVFTGQTPDFVYRCNALYKTTAGFLWRCEKHEQHGGEHGANALALTWSDARTYGYVEEK